jgi:hypothetical protein
MFRHLKELGTKLTSPHQVMMGTGRMSGGEFMLDWGTGLAAGIVAATMALGCGGSSHASNSNWNSNGLGGAAGEQQLSSSGSSNASAGQPGSSGGTGGMLVRDESVAGGSSAGRGGDGSAAGSAGGGAAGSAGGSAYPPFACSLASLFTACVKACGEPDDKESKSAECVDGFYTCPAPLIVAASCPDDAWPDGAYAGCGPWVHGYDCQCRAECKNRQWTCGSDCP